MKKVLALVLAALMVFALVACGGTKDSGETTTAAGETTEVNQKTLVMATNAQFPPYEFKDGDGFAGIDIEIAEAVAKKLDMKLEIADVKFGAIVGGVQSGKYDMGLAGMTITEERLESVNFSDSYATGIQAVIVKEDSSIKKVGDIKSDGSMKVGVQQDTTGDIYASDVPEKGGFNEENVIRYDAGADAVQALKVGKVDAVIIDNEPAKEFVKANEGLKILDEKFTEEDYAACFAKENTELLNNFNKALAELKADGTIDSIIAKYIPAK